MILGIIVGVLSFIPSVLYYFFLKGLKEDEQYKKDCRKTLIRGLGSGVPVFLLMAHPFIFWLIFVPLAVLGIIKFITWLKK